MRKLTNSEITSLASHYAIDKGLKGTAVEEKILKECTTIAIDSYQSDTPGYSGTLYLVIGSGGPELYQLFDKNFSPIEQDVIVRDF